MQPSQPCPAKDGAHRTGAFTILDCIHIRNAVTEIDHRIDAGRFGRAEEAGKKLQRRGAFLGICISAVMDIRDDSDWEICHDYLC